MPLTAGIVGLPNVGKSTLFNAITQAGAESANYPFCTIEPNVGVVNLPDDRLSSIARIIQPRKVIPTTCQFVDIAGLVKGASKGEGLGNRFLSHIREVDAIVHVVRCFEDDQITHVSGKVNPLDDIETITMELVLADLETVEKRLDRVARQKKSGDKEASREHKILSQLQERLAAGQPARTVALEEEEAQRVKGLNLLTMKNVLYVCNLKEDEALTAEENERVQEVKRFAEQEGAEVVTICAQLEAEIAELVGYSKPGLHRVIEATYRLLGLATFFTAGEKEVRAWTIREGAKAPEAAGVIHSDFERLFIRAEVMTYEDLIQSGTPQEVQEKGLLRVEGKDYTVQDGDIIHFLTQKG